VGFLYILLVCSQYKRFIELIRQNGVEHAFRGRYTAALSTSINFYDTTAHRYIHSVCDDLEMRYVGFHSANMHDLMKPEGRLRLEQFAQELADAVETRAEAPRTYAPVPDALIPTRLHRTRLFRPCRTRALSSLPTGASPPAAGGS